MSLIAGTVIPSDDSYTSNVFITSADANFIVSNNACVGLVYNNGGSVEGVEENQTPTAPEASETVEISTWEALKDALTSTSTVESGKILKLTADLTHTTETTGYAITTKVDRTIDLNGHSITITEGDGKGYTSSHGGIGIDSNIILQDTKGEGYVKGIITQNNTSFDLFGLREETASSISLTMNSGSLYVELAEGASVYAAGSAAAVDVYPYRSNVTAEFIMNGGSIVADRRPDSIGGQGVECVRTYVQICDSGAKATTTINNGYLQGRNGVFLQISSYSKNLDNNITINGGVLDGYQGAIRIYGTGSAAENVCCAKIKLGKATYLYEDKAKADSQYFDGAIECHNLPTAGTYGLFDVVEVDNSARQ